MTLLKRLQYHLQRWTITELQYWKAVLGSVQKQRVSVIPFVPNRRQTPSRMLQVESAWKGIESILADLIDRFHVGSERCLEFGVEHGYSTVALSSFFHSVIGVDTFRGDKDTENKSDLYAETLSRLSRFDNVHLIRADYKDWIRKDDSSYDLIHVDIVHTFADTFACGLWSAKHSKCVIFHDTKSFPTVKRAVIEVARATGRRFFNFEGSNGLGILV